MQMSCLRTVSVVVSLAFIHGRAADTRNGLGVWQCVVLPKKVTHRTFGAQERVHLVFFGELN